MMMMMIMMPMMTMMTASRLGQPPIEGPALLETCLGIIPGLIVGDVDVGELMMMVLPLFLLTSMTSHSYQMVPTGRSEQPTEDAPFTANRVIFCQILHL